MQLTFHINEISNLLGINHDNHNFKLMTSIAVFKVLKEMIKMQLIAIVKPIITGKCLNIYLCTLF